jgi:MFS superfamily sulfate permease-like transporter
MAEHQLPPLDGIAGLKQNWKSDIVSGFSVFLIALPLCLGIALASGVPPLSGITAAVVGGLLVSMISGCRVAINGPAAGLIVVILSAVDTLGGGDKILGYRCALAAIVVAGLVQIVMGLTKAGKLSSFFPASAVHGLLASIGIIIIAKQSYVMLGEKAIGHSALEQLYHLPGAIEGTNPEVAIIGLATLAVVVLLPMIPGLKRLPAPLVGVLLGMGLGYFYDLEHEHTYLAFVNHSYHLGPDFLVTLPGNVLNGIVTPDWSKVGQLIFWKAVMMIAVIASLESLLSASAIDKLDPYQRKSDLNKDLTAMGVGTAVSGMLGGLPMIAEIVRSSANVNAGAKTRWSNFFHGAFLLTFVCLAPGLIHHIPLSSLAAILCVTGFRLASPKEFKKVYHLGSDQFTIFVTTIIITLSTDLLVGILSGIAIKLFIHMRRGVSVKQLVKSDVEINNESEWTEVHLKGAAVFTNLLGLRSKLEELPKGLRIHVNLQETKVVDHSVLEYLEHFQHDYVHAGGSVHLEGLEQHKSMSDHSLSAKTLVR